MKTETGSPVGASGLLGSPIIDKRRWMVWVWVLFTIALASWQFMFLVSLLSDPAALLSQTEESQRYLRMVYYENFTLILSLLLGGGALFILLRKEHQKALAQQEFFATFTHEIKTSIAGLKLRLERLQKENTKELSFQAREDLMNDLSKLEVQLENSLFLARGNEDQLLTEKLNFKDFLLAMGPQSDLQVHLKKNFSIHGDRRALETIFKNIILNAILHGKAENLWIEVDEASKQMIKVTVHDDGGGFKGDLSQLGNLFYRPTSRSGNGIGLYLVRVLSERLGGKAVFSTGPNSGFQITIDLPGEISGGRSDKEA